ncbi:MAG: hypothetical protein LKJ03_07300 [Enterococcaceae bacterium]|jgi:hypothetical protein|nr:hypothetical protein [Enterococcaceae bacterium]
MNFATFSGEKFDNWKMRLPEEDELKGHDWRGEEIYEGDLVREINGELIKVNDIEEYLDSEFGPSFEA